MTPAQGDSWAKGRGSRLSQNWSLRPEKCSTLAAGRTWDLQKNAVLGADFDVLYIVFLVERILVRGRELVTGEWDCCSSCLGIMGEADA